MAEQRASKCIHLAVDAVLSRQPSAVAGLACWYTVPHDVRTVGDLTLKICNDLALAWAPTVEGVAAAEQPLLPLLLRADVHLAPTLSVDILLDGDLLRLVSAPELHQQKLAGDSVYDEGQRQHEAPHTWQDAGAQQPVAWQDADDGTHHAAEKGPDAEAPDAKAAQPSEQGKQGRNWRRLALHGMGAATCAAALPLLAPTALAMAGFTSTGIAGGSMAAGWMSSIAASNGVGVVAGSTFATLQSMGMGGVAVPVMQLAATGGGMYAGAASAVAGLGHVFRWRGRGSAPPPSDPQAAATEEAQAAAAKAPSEK